LIYPRRKKHGVGKVDRLVSFLSVWIIIIATCGFAFAKRVTINFDDVQDGSELGEAYKEDGVVFGCRGPWPEHPLVNDRRAFSYQDYHALSGNNVIGGRFLADGPNHWVHWLSFPIGYGVARFVDPVDYLSLYGVGGPFQVVVYDEQYRNVGTVLSHALDVIHPTGCNVHFVEIGGNEPDTGGLLIKGIKFGSIYGQYMADLTYFDDLTFNVNQAPMADAGPDQTVYEGTTVTLDGGLSTDPDGESDIDLFLWEQIEGPTVALSDPTIACPTLVAPPVDANGATVGFQLMVADRGGLQDMAEVCISIQDNGITGFGFPPDAVTIYTTTNEPIAIRVDSDSHLTKLHMIDPSTLPDAGDGMPDDLVFGLIEMELLVDQPDHTAAVSIYFPRAMSVDHTWYKYSSILRWVNFSRKKISSGVGDGAVFSGDRTRVTLYITDNGEYDDDTRLMILKDPSGLGLLAPTASSGPSPRLALKSSGGGGCFIDAAAKSFRLRKQSL
jgi:hypothetical protein